MDSTKLIKERSSVLIFDGICNLCSGLVRFIIKHDPDKRILLASLQSNIGQNLIQQSFNLNNQVDSIVLIENDSVLVKSKAVFRVVELLGGPWKLLLIFKVFPYGFNDRIYDFIAKYRYNLFGKRNQCLMPTDYNRDHFLES